MKKPLIDIGQVWVSKSSWGDVDGITTTDDSDKTKRIVTSVEEETISYKIKGEDKIFQNSIQEFLEDFRHFPFVDITPEEIIEKLNISVAQPDYPYGNKNHKENIHAIRVQIAANDNKPLYFIGLDNGRHFKVVSVYWKDLNFIMKHYSDGSLKPNLNRLNEDHFEGLEELKIRIKHRRPMRFKPHTVTTKSHFEDGKWIPEGSRFIDWDSEEGDKIIKGSLILKIWKWETTLGFYKIYRLTSPEKIEPYI